MGIDYNSFLIIGTKISYEKYKSILDNNEIEEEILSDLDYFKSDHYKNDEEVVEQVTKIDELLEGISIIQTCPYYDCRSSESNYYLVINTKKSLSLDEIKELDDNILQKVYIKLFGSLDGYNFMITSDYHIS